MNKNAVIQFIYPVTVRDAGTAVAIQHVTLEVSTNGDGYGIAVCDRVPFDDKYLRRYRKVSTRGWYLHFTTVTIQGIDTSHLVVGMLAYINPVDSHGQLSVGQFILTEIGTDFIVYEQDADIGGDANGDNSFIVDAGWAIPAHSFLAFSLQPSFFDAGQTLPP